jgi:hypothetical protein
MTQQDITGLIMEVTLSYLHSIGAKVKKFNDVYEIELPAGHKDILGNKNRLAFSQQVAQEHNCELVAPGSNILNKLISMWGTKMPVIYAKIREGNDSPSLQNFDFSNVIKNANTRIKSKELRKGHALRLYYTISFKSTRNKMFLDFLTIDLHDSEIYELNGHSLPAFESLDENKNHLALDQLKLKNAFEKFNIALDYILAHETGFLDEMQSDLDLEIQFISKNYDSMINDISEELANLRSSILNIGKKISAARTQDSRKKFTKIKATALKKMAVAEKEARKQIDGLHSLKEAEIEKAKTRFRTVVEVSVFACIVIAHNQLVCNVTLENKDTSTNARLSYNKARGIFQATCHVCSNSSDQIYLCKNNHLSCSGCTMMCSSCLSYCCVRCVDLCPHANEHCKGTWIEVRYVGESGVTAAITS